MAGSARPVRPGGLIITSAALMLVVGLAYSTREPVAGVVRGDSLGDSVVVTTYLGCRGASSTRTRRPLASYSWRSGKGDSP